MSAELQRLMFSVSLLDQVTGPAGKIKKEMNSVAESSKAAFAQIGIGAAGIAGAGLAMQSLLMPAIEMDRALGEVRSLGVAESALNDLSETALAFSVQYGKSAAEFVSASYDIQSAIAGLSGQELSRFTQAGGVLAAATKSNTATITNYMGTMYGVFKNTADQMGKSQWVEVLAGQTATAVQMFKTTGDNMSAAFTSIGANATAAGISMNEQMAVLGTLQATMSGSEAGTKYKAFLAGVGNAQKQLGLTFTDSNGQMLGMVEILNQLKGKFGETMDVAESDALKKAFGSDEAVSLVKQLMADTNGLASSIDALGKVKGMGKAEEMAAAMVDPWERLGEGIKAVKIAFGQALLPVINPIVDAMADGSNALIAWTKEFPNITRWIGIATAAILGISAALAALTVIVGISKLVWSGLLIVKAVGVAFGALVPSLASIKAAFLALNLVMYANPIGLIVAGVAALVLAIGAAIYWWDDLKKAFMDSSWGQYIIGMINKLIGVLNLVPGIDIGTIGGADISTPNLDAPKQTNLPAGGINKQISNAVSNNSNSSKSVTIGQIVTNQPAASIEQEMLMAGA
ncbi:phage tail tape measure protein [Endozoicomonas sp. GU-1]|uniref:phage tail tape measure protein n=1 Tax=Endozoicomonas sp. GU-1 TaxID=3009078 RepID=UPI0022B4AA1C|nr:phage tail tape measure protein [Endozoicomonas sp. GU-1]WBA86528.1 phage tail tape measure protein [Endozoicomonas sp. GU-1]